MQFALDVFTGLSIASWGVAVLVQERGPPLSVRIAIAVIDATVGALFVARGPAHAEGCRGAVVAALPSLMVGGVALKIAPERAWPFACEAAFVSAAALGLVALLTLGRSFAILPARRVLVVRSLYRIVRHPMYACELAMVVAAGAARAWWAGLVLGLVLLVTLAPRIRAEEALLAGDPAWAAYAARVRWRILPGAY